MLSCDRDAYRSFNVNQAPILNRDDQRRDGFYGGEPEEEETHEKNEPVCFQCPKCEKNHTDASFSSSTRV